MSDWLRKAWGSSVQIQTVEKTLKPSKEAPASDIYIPPHYVTCNLCPGLHAITTFLRLCVHLSRKIATATSFRTSRFSITSLFFSLGRRGFRIHQIMWKLRQIGTATICFTLRFFITSLSFSPSRRGFRIQQILRKLRKLVPSSHLSISPYVFIT